MSTYGVMIDRIGDELDRPDLSAQIKLAVQTAIDHYESERFYFSERRATLDTSAGASYYSVPTDFQKIDVLTMIENGRRTKLLPVPFEWIENTDSNVSAVGHPSYFAIYNEQLRLYPVPDDAYRMELAYVCNLGELSATADTNAWMTDAEEVIRMHAKIDLLASVIRGPDSLQEAAFLKQLEDQAAKRLRYETNRRRSLGKIMPWP